jgi:hypothetical protein
MKPGTRIEVLPNPVACPTGPGTVVDLKDYPMMGVGAEPFTIGITSDAHPTTANKLCFFIDADHVEEL